MTEPRSLRETLAWQEDARCLEFDPEVFYVPGVAAEREAKAICAGCHVRDACLTRALDTGERYGVWGGMTEQERRNIGRVRYARHLGACDDCGRPRHSIRYPDRPLPAGGVWNGRNHAHGRMLCQDCRAARDAAEADEHGKEDAV